MKSLLVLLVYGSILMGGGDCVAATPTEYQLKAAFLLNFARYIEWPATKLPAAMPIRICVLGRDPFADALTALDGRQAQGHDVRVRTIETVDRAADCHVLFVSESEERRLVNVLHATSGKAILTVSDIDGFADAGGAIAFVNEDDRVRFDINYGILQRDSLRASAQLLRLGRNVLGLKVP